MKCCLKLFRSKRVQPKPNTIPEERVVEFQDTPMFRKISPRSLHRSEAKQKIIQLPPLKMIEKDNISSSMNSSSLEEEEELEELSKEINNIRNLLDPKMLFPDQKNNNESSKMKVMQKLFNIGKISGSKQTENDYNMNIKNKVTKKFSKENNIQNPLKKNKFKKVPLVTPPPTPIIKADEKPQVKIKKIAKSEFGKKNDKSRLKAVKNNTSFEDSFTLKHNSKVSIRPHASSYQLIGQKNLKEQIPERKSSDFRSINTSNQQKATKNIHLFSGNYLPRNSIGGTKHNQPRVGVDLLGKLRNGEIQSKPNSVKSLQKKDTSYYSINTNKKSAFFESRNEENDATLRKGIKSLSSSRSENESKKNNEVSDKSEISPIKDFIPPQVNEFIPSDVDSSKELGSSNNFLLRKSSNKPNKNGRNSYEKKLRFKENDTSLLLRTNSLGVNSNHKNVRESSPNQDITLKLSKIDEVNSPQEKMLRLRKEIKEKIKYKRSATETSKNNNLVSFLKAPKTNLNNSGYSALDSSISQKESKFESQILDVSVDLEGFKHVMDYKLTGLIGEGAFCQVRRAVHKKTKKTYVSKILKRRLKL